MFFLKTLLHHHHWNQSRIRRHQRAPKETHMYVTQMHQLLYAVHFSEWVFNISELKQKKKKI